MARGLHSHWPYIFVEPKARQICQGSYEAEGHITRKISADIYEREVYIVLILALIFIIIVGRYIAWTKNILQVNRQLLG